MPEVCLKQMAQGSGISLGHPVAAIGCLLVVKALYELRRIGGKYVLVTLCIGGGRGLRRSLPPCESAGLS